MTVSCLEKAISRGDKRKLQMVLRDILPAVAIVDGMSHPAFPCQISGRKPSATSLKGIRDQRMKVPDFSPGNFKNLLPMGAIVTRTVDRRAMT